jgi:hypothetical protein
MSENWATLYLLIDVQTFNYHRHNFCMIYLTEFIQKVEAVYNIRSVTECFILLFLFSLIVRFTNRER